MIARLLSRTAFSPGLSSLVITGISSPAENIIDLIDVSLFEISFSSLPPKLSLVLDHHRGELFFVYSL